MTNEWTVNQRKVRVVKTDGGARLFVDDQLLDATNDLYASGDEPTLAGAFGDTIVEAFVKPIGEAAIRVNGEYVTAAYAAAS